MSHRNLLQTPGRLSLVVTLILAITIVSNMIITLPFTVAAIVIMMILVVVVMVLVVVMMTICIPFTTPCHAQVCAELFDWSRDLAHRQYEVALACDVLYAHASIDSFAKAVPRLLNEASDTLLLLADPSNRTRENRCALASVCLHLLGHISVELGCQSNVSMLHRVAQALSSLSIGASHIHLQLAWSQCMTLLVMGCTLDQRCAQAQGCNHLKDDKRMLACTRECTHPDMHLPAFRSP